MIYEEKDSLGNPLPTYFPLSDCKNYAEYKIAISINDFLKAVSTEIKIGNFVEYDRVTKSAKVNLRKNIHFYFHE